MVVILVVSSIRIRSPFYIRTCTHRTSYLRLLIMPKLVLVRVFICSWVYSFKKWVLEAQKL